MEFSTSQSKSPCLGCKILCLRTYRLECNADRFATTPADLRWLHRHSALILNGALECSKADRIERQRNASFCFRINNVTSHEIAPELCFNFIVENLFEE